MTEPTIHEIQQDLNTRIAAFGEELAQELAPQVAALLQRELDDFEQEGTDPLWQDIHVPALAWHTLLHLANNVVKQSEGWADVFFTNLRKRYLKEHETEERP